MWKWLTACPDPSEFLQQPIGRPRGETEGDDPVPFPDSGSRFLYIYMYRNIHTYMNTIYLYIYIHIYVHICFPDRPGGNPGANAWFLESTPIQMLPESVSICRRLTSDLPLGCLQGDSGSQIVTQIPDPNLFSGSRIPADRMDGRDRGRRSGFLPGFCIPVCNPGSGSQFVTWIPGPNLLTRFRIPVCYPDSGSQFVTRIPDSSLFAGSRIPVWFPHSGSRNPDPESRIGNRGGV